MQTQVVFIVWFPVDLIQMIQTYLTIICSICMVLIVDTLHLLLIRWFKKTLQFNLKMDQEYLILVIESLSKRICGIKIQVSAGKKLRMIQQLLNGLLWIITMLMLIPQVSYGSLKHQLVNFRKFTPSLHSKTMLSQRFSPLEIESSCIQLRRLLMPIPTFSLSTVMTVERLHI